jgi:hypothetical protein
MTHDAAKFRDNAQLLLAVEVVADVAVEEFAGAFFGGVANEDGDGDGRAGAGEAGASGD